MYAQLSSDLLGQRLLWLKLKLELELQLSDRACVGNFSGNYVAIFKFIHYFNFVIYRFS